MLKSKIHSAIVTRTEVDYEGSAGIDADLLQAADILPYEQVHVLDLDNGSRLETYAIEEPAGSGQVAIYGAAARLVTKGDRVIILSYRSVEEEEAARAAPRVVHVDSRNRVMAPVGR